MAYSVSIGKELKGYDASLRVKAGKTLTELMSIVFGLKMRQLSMRLVSSSCQTPGGCKKYLIACSVSTGRELRVVVLKSKQEGEMRRGRREREM